MSKANEMFNKLGFYKKACHEGFYYERVIGDCLTLVIIFNEVRCGVRCLEVDKCDGFDTPLEMSDDLLEPINLLLKELGWV